MVNNKSTDKKINSMEIKTLKFAHPLALEFIFKHFLALLVSYFSFLDSCDVLFTFVF